MRPIESLGENTILIQTREQQQDLLGLCKMISSRRLQHVFARPLKADWLRCSSEGEDNFNVKPVSKDERRKRL